MDSQPPPDAAPVALIRSRLVESLYAEAMLLADEARSYFEANPRIDAEVDPITRIGMSCEWLKTTTRLMHVIAWLLTQRAVQAGELSETQARVHDRMLGDAVASDGELCRRLPDRARLLIVASEQLYQRALRLQELLHADQASDQGPARALIERVRALV